MSHPLVARAHHVAETVLFPAAVDVDRSGRIPETHWRALADAGLYGIADPAAGLDFPDIVEIIEVIASGCLATGFTWVQHHGMLAALSASENTALHDELAADAAAGRIRGGVAFAGAVPVPPRMIADRVGNSGWRLSGFAPFVSGWGVIDVIQYSAGDRETGDIVSGVLPAGELDGIVTVTPQPLFVADATSTVSLTVDGLFIPDGRVVSRVTREQFLANQNFGSRLNGTLPIGVARRCASVLDDSGERDAAAAIRTEIMEVRRRLDAGLADSAALLTARADGAELATRAAAAAVAGGGGPGILRDAVPQLLARNAIFTLVAASRPELKASLVQRFAGASGSRGRTTSS